MSVEMVVFVRKERMVSPIEWQDAISKNGFAMEIDTVFDVEEFSGFLPCKYKGKEAGFEYYYQKLGNDIEDDIRQHIADRDIAVVFVTHSDFRELMTSVIAVGVLSAITDGVIYDTEAGEFTQANAALDWAKTGEKSISEEL